MNHPLCFVLSCSNCRYRKTLSHVRPHEVDEELLEGLSVEMPDLFDWALESSREYFKEMDDFDDGAAMQDPEHTTLGGSGGEDALDHTMMVGPTKRMDMGMDNMKQAAGGGTTTAQTSGDTTMQATALTPAHGQAGSEKRRGPMLEVGPTSHLLFVSRDPTALVRNEVVLRNVGSTALFYSLKRQDTGTTLTDAYRAPARDTVLPPVKPLFTCHGAEGMVLPGSEVVVTWSFKAMHTGAFSEKWSLHTTPKARFHTGGGPSRMRWRHSTRASRGSVGGWREARRKSRPPPRPSPVACTRCVCAGCVRSRTRMSTTVRRCGGP